MATSPIPLPPCDDKPLWDLWLSNYTFYQVMAATELGIFEALAKQPLNEVQVAEAIGIPLRQTTALIEGMLAMGFLARNLDKYAITTLAQTYLLQESPFFWGGLFKFMQSIPFNYGTFLQALRTDRTAYFDANDIWESHQLSPEMAGIFTGFMHCHGIAAATALATQPLLSEIRDLLDAGGGSGIYSIAMARAHEQLQCTIMETTAVCPIAERNIEHFQVSDRVKTRCANMFAHSWPGAPYDAVFFSDIFHDWMEDKCSLLIQKAKDALGPGGKILIHEVLLDGPHAGSITPSLYSVAMASSTEGKQYRGQELAELLQKGGFSQIQITPAYGYYSLITGSL